jgi:hypothetical protein
MNGVQAPRFDAVLDRASPEAETHELAAADDTMLALGNVGDRPFIRPDADVSYFDPRI